MPRGQKKSLVLQVTQLETAVKSNQATLLLQSSILPPYLTVQGGVTEIDNRHSVIFVSSFST